MGEPVEIRAPFENVNDDSVAVVRWLVEDGSLVAVGTPVLLAETTKASFDVVSPQAGYICQVARAGSDVPVGGVMAVVADELTQARAAAAAGRPGAPAAVVSTVEPSTERAADDQRRVAVSAGGELAASPADDRMWSPPAHTRFSARALALMREHKIEADAFTGRGLVRAADVEALAGGGAASTVSHQAPSGPLVTNPVRGVDAMPERSTPTPVPGVPTRSESLPRAKRYEARQLRTGVASTVPSSVSVSVPTRGFFSGGEGFAEPAGTAAAAIIYETARLLRLYPLFNACYAGDAIRYYEQVNIGYAVDLGQGLKVPVIKDADTKSLREIAEEKQRLVVDYLGESLSLDALTGGTFTVTDLSGEGVAHFQPLLNAGQSAILGICAETYPGGDGNGSFNLVLAFDHQVAEGRTAAAFLRDLRDRIRAHEASWRINHEPALPEPLPEPQCGTCLRPAAELEAARQFLVRTVRQAGGDELVCTLCLQDW